MHQGERLNGRASQGVLVASTGAAKVSENADALRMAREWKPTKISTGVADSEQGGATCLTG
jgi:hypothetical protein